MDTIFLIGIIAGVLTAISLLPQLIKILKEKKAEDVSIWMLVILLAGLGCWIVYGFMKEDLPIMITNSFSFIVNSAIVFLRFKYK
jgi:MtN3 and saliva related transmembrane protein